MYASQPTHLPNDRLFVCPVDRRSIESTTGAKPPTPKTIPTHPASTSIEVPTKKEHQQQIWQKQQKHRKLVVAIFR